MKLAGRSGDEEQRLEALQHCDLLDSPPEQALDDLTALAAEICHAPIALISLIDGERQWFKSKFGLSISETPRATSFCGHTILQSHTFIVPDAATDARFADNPLVTGDPRVRFYAGVPLTNQEGFALGTFAVIDRVPRTLTPAQLHALEVLGRQVIAQLELRRQTRELARTALALGHERFQVVARATNDAIRDWNLFNNALWWNENHESLFGYPPHETDPTIRSWIDHIHPGDVTRTLQDIQDVIDRGGSAWTGEYRFQRRDGSYAEIFERAYVMHDSRGNAVRLIGAMQDVTARKRAEADARLLTQRLMLATEAGSIGIWDWDLETDRWYASNTYFTMLGYDAAEGFQDRNVWFERVHPDDRKGVGERISAVLSGTATVYQYEARVRHANGIYRWVNVVGRALEVDQRGMPKRLLGVRMDVTERKRAEQRVEQLNRTYAVLSDINQTIVREKDPQAMLAAACRIAIEKGRFAMAWIGLLDPAGNRLQIAAHAGADPETREIVAGLLEPAQGGPRCAFTSYALATGRIGICNEIESDRDAAAWREDALHRGYRAMAALPLTVATRVVGTFNLYASEPGFFDEDEIRLLEELAVDIAFALQISDQEAERRRVERALGESEQRFRQLAESIQEVFWMTEPATGQMLYLSPAYEMIWGRTCDSVYEFPGTWLEAIFSEDRERVAAARLATNTSAGYDEEYRIVRPDGGIRWVRDRAFPVRDPSGQVQRIAGVAEDVTARHAAQLELRRREEEFRSLIENVSDIVTVLDAQGVIVFQSPSAERVLGYTASEMLGKNSREFVHPDDVTHATAALQAGLTSRAAPLSVEYRFRHRDDSWRILQSVGRFMPREAGAGLVVINSRDVTEQRALEDQLRQSQKMEAIGQLAGGIAHDFNNILTVIHGYGSLLMTGENVPVETAEAAQQIVQASEQAANLTRQLLAFGRRQVLQPRNLDLNEVVRGLVKMLRRLVAEDVRLSLELDPRPLLTRADAGMLDQVLMNLVVNARDAMPDGGHLVIQTSFRDVTEDETRALPDAKCGRYVCLRVNDTGTGIAEEHRAHIFEPFFTTKDPGKGTGLGLATVFGIIKQHGGFLRLDTRLGRGTSIEALLPAVEAETTQARLPDVTGLRAGTETILLVEDEDAVRRLTRAVLERTGYRVLEASNGIEALRIWEQHSRSIQLILTDIVMPGGLNGLELVTRLHALNPQLRVIFTSGYSADIAGRELILREGENFVQKPSSPQQILQTVRRCLDV